MTKIVDNLSTLKEIVQGREKSGAIVYCKSFSCALQIITVNWSIKSILSRFKHPLQFIEPKRIIDYFVLEW